MCCSAMTRREMRERSMFSRKPSSCGCVVGRREAWVVRACAHGMRGAAAGVQQQRSGSSGGSSSSLGPSRAAARRRRAWSEPLACPAPARPAWGLRERYRWRERTGPEGAGVRAGAAAGLCAGKREASGVTGSGRQQAAHSAHPRGGAAAWRGRRSGGGRARGAGPAAW